MSTCASFTDQILTASVEDLSGRGDTPLARHVRTCPRCAAIARRVLEDTESLDRMLQGSASVRELDVEALLARAEGTDRSEATHPPITEGSAGRPRRKRTSRWVALAAAAGLASLLVLARHGRRLDQLPRQAANAAARTEQPVPTVEASPGHDVAVIPTDDPDITVVWYF